MIDFDETLMILIKMGYAQEDDYENDTELHNAYDFFRIFQKIIVTRMKKT